MRKVACYATKCSIKDSCKRYELHRLKYEVEYTINPKTQGEQCANFVPKQRHSELINFEGMGG